MRPIAILVTGEPVARARATRGSFSDMIRAAVGDHWLGPWLELDARRSEPWPEAASLAGMIVTGSSASVTDREPWVVEIEARLAALVASTTPVFGICFGHQVLGQALGGQVLKNPRGRQIGTVDAEVSADDPLLAGISGPLRVNTSHRDVLAELPPGARVVGTTPLDPHAFVRFGERAFGVQVHPEFDAVTMRAYVEERREILAGEGFDVDALLGRVEAAEAAAAVLARFVADLTRSG